MYTVCCVSACGYSYVTLAKNGACSFDKCTLIFNYLSLIDEHKFAILISPQSSLNIAPNFKGVFTLTCETC